MIFESESIRLEIEETDSKKESKKIMERHDEFYDDLVEFLGKYLQSGDTEYIMLIYEGAMYYMEDKDDPSTMCSLITMVSSFLSDDVSSVDTELAFVHDLLLNLSVQYNCIAVQHR